MKKYLFTLLAVSFIGANFTAMAQQPDQPTQKETPPPPPPFPERPEAPEPAERPERPERKEQQELIIKTKKDTNISLKLQINGDKVTINGKPLEEFKVDGITINKRKIFIRDGNNNMMFNMEGMEGMSDLMGLGNFNDNGKPKPFLGITTEKSAEGAKIVTIAKGTAAEKAGLKKDDIITNVDGETVTDAAVLAKIIAAKKPKDEVKIGYKRGGKKMDLKAVLGDRQQSREGNYAFQFNHPQVRTFKLPPNHPQVPGVNENLNMDNFDFSQFENLSGADFPRQKKLGLKIQDTQEGGNVKIIEVADSSAAQKAGLKKDDLITAINDQKISNTDDAREQLQEVADKPVYTIKATRAGSEMSFDIKNPKKLKTANL